MKRYIKSSDENITIDDVWAAIPKEYRPYIDEITIVPQHSIYRNKDIITYNAYFKNSVWEDDRDPVIGIFHAEDVPTLVNGVVDHLTAKFPEIKKQIMNRWHPKRNRGW